MFGIDAVTLLVQRLLHEELPTLSPVAEATRGREDLVRYGNDTMGRSCHLETLSGGPCTYRVLARLGCIQLSAAFRGPAVDSTVGDARGQLWVDFAGALSVAERSHGAGLVDLWAPRQRVWHSANQLGAAPAVAADAPPWGGDAEQR